MQYIRDLYSKLSTVQKVLFWFIILSIILQVALRFYTQGSSLNPVEVPVEIVSIPQVEEITAQEVLVQAPFPEIPEKMPIYTATLLTAEEMHENFIQTLQLTRHETLNWYAENDTTGFSSLLDEKLKQVTIARILKPTQEVNTPLTPEQLTQRAQDFLTQFQINDLVTPDITGIVTVKPHDPEEEQELGTIFYIPFYQKINEYPVVYNTRIEPAVSIYIDETGRVGKATFNPLPKEIVVAGENATISTAELNQVILTLKPSVLLITENEELFSDLRSFSTITITKMSIQYRSTPTSNLLIPYIHLDATATDGSATARLEMIYPLSK